MPQPSPPPSPPAPRARRPRVRPRAAGSGGLDEDDANHYNVQLFRGGRKILSVWPATNRLTLPKTWTFGGRRQALTPGVYRSYVWPGFGLRSRARYGAVLGERTFVVAA